MDQAALLVIDAQEEYFARIGKLVLPDGPAAVERIAPVLESARRRGVPVARAEGAVTGPDGVRIPHDVVHRTHLGSLDGFLAEVRDGADLIA